ncbi:MAG TPA: ATP-binding cassette domain-containing protein [Bacteriovoracaceae bacterium]|nr:ATP-binding cassette domain-containing protein [Bacteriovoracaceae bacterium]
MTSTENSEVLLRVKNLKVHFELEHYGHQGLRDVFVSALSHPLDFFFKSPELLYVIDDLSFEIAKGTRLGILGVNGSGKTTLCRCLAGMMKGQRGVIETTCEVRAIFDTGTGIMPALTGRENAQLLGRLFFPEVENLDPIVNEAIDFSELGHFIDVPFYQYSKGMQSRLLLSLVSAKSTDILILDEVFDGADIFFQKKLAVRMKSFIERAGATIFVSHSVEQIRDVCNKVMVLDHGKLLFLGDLEPGIEHYLSKPSS